MSMKKKGRCEGKDYLQFKKKRGEKELVHMIEKGRKGGIEGKGELLTTPEEKKKGDLLRKKRGKDGHEEGGISATYRVGRGGGGHGDYFSKEGGEGQRAL